MSTFKLCLKTKLADIFNRIWYEKSKYNAIFLIPFSWVYRLIVYIRTTRFKWMMQTTTQKQAHKTPVIVVGNLTVGGVGKTPCVIALVEHIQAKGIRVGIVSRGYGGSFSGQPHRVRSEDDANLVGDEPALMLKKTGVPVVIAKHRQKAVEFLVEQAAVDVIISDDGLQHVQMKRDIELLVVDGQRQFGNGYCLPAGPLREPLSRLNTVDCVIANGLVTEDLASTVGRPVFSMHYKVGSIDPSIPDSNKSLAAISGIGHPQRFFDTLSTLNLNFKAYPFCDHHPFCAKDLLVDEHMLIMTEKDAIKCHGLTQKPIYTLPISAQLPDAFWSKFDALLHEVLG